MRIYFYICLIIGASVFATSCSNNQYQNIFQQTASPDGTGRETPARQTDYHIRPQDVLQIRNLQNIKYLVDETPASSTGTGGGGNSGSGQTFQVESDSTVALPAIGRVKVGGLTRSEAAKLIAGFYRKSLLKDPTIEVKIVNLKVAILREIKGQGNYPLTKYRTTLVELIGETGGLTEKANEANIKITRGNQLSPEVAIVDLTDIWSFNSPGALLQNGDIIYIAQDKRAIRNDKLQNFSVITRPVLLLLNTGLIILTLSHR